MTRASWVLQKGMQDSGPQNVKRSRVESATATRLELGSKSHALVVFENENKIEFDRPPLHLKQLNRMAIRTTAANT